MSRSGDLRLIALRDVLEEPEEYLTRKICRWYSRELSTPIDAVRDLPWDEVLRAYFEATYEEMEEADLAEEIVKMTETDAERTERQRREQAAGARESATEVEFLRMTAERALKGAISGT